MEKIETAKITPLTVLPIYPKKNEFAWRIQNKKFNPNPDLYRSPYLFKYNYKPRCRFDGIRVNIILFYLSDSFYPYRYTIPKYRYSSMIFNTKEIAMPRDIIDLNINWLKCLVPKIIDFLNNPTPKKKYNKISTETFVWVSVIFRLIGFNDNNYYFCKEPRVFFWNIDKTTDIVKSFEENIAKLEDKVKKLSSDFNLSLHSIEYFDVSFKGSSPYSKYKPFFNTTIGILPNPKTDDVDIDDFDMIDSDTDDSDTDDSDTDDSDTDDSDTQVWTDI